MVCKSLLNVRQISVKCEGWFECSRSIASERRPISNAIPDRRKEKRSSQCDQLWFYKYKGRNLVGLNFYNGAIPFNVLIRFFPRCDDLEMGLNCPMKMFVCLIMWKYHPLSENFNAADHFGILRKKFYLNSCLWVFFKWDNCEKLWCIKK